MFNGEKAGVGGLLAISSRFVVGLSGLLTFRLSQLLTMLHVFVTSLPLIGFSNDVRSFVQESVFVSVKSQQFSPLSLTIYVLGIYFTANFLLSVFYLE